jgi:PAS domain-containing protein
MHKTAGYHRIHAEGRSHQLRRRVALEAARLISEHGIRDFRMAKRKAAQRIGVSDDGFLPRNREIEDALREHQRLFRADEQPLALRLRREAARDAMRFFDRFDPRLVGPVLEGTADTHSPVVLHVFDDSLEDVTGSLRDHGIAFETRARTLRIDRTHNAEFPVLLFDADGVPMDVTVFPRDALRQAPLDPVSERPQRRASLAAVEMMLERVG